MTEPDDDKTYDAQTPFALGESWGRIYNGLKSKGVPDQQAAEIVIAWITVVSSPRKEVLDDER